MTIRYIATAANLPNTDGIVKAWNLLNIGRHPGLDADLPADHAVLLLSYLSQPTTRRTPEKAAVFAGLLADLQNGNGQTRHAEPAKPEIVRPVTADKPTRARTAKVAVAQPVTAQQPDKRRFTWPSVSMLDIVYMSTIATAVYGLWFTLAEMGAAFAVPYCLISWHALRMAKNPANRKTAQAGIPAVVVLEILTFFVHLVLFNLRTVQAAKANILPFEYSFWGSTSTPFTIACILAGLFSAAGIYAVSVTFSLTSEKHTAAEQAKQAAERQAANVETLRAALEDSARQWMDASGKNNFDTERAGVFAERYFNILKNTI